MPTSSVRSREPNGIRSVLLKTQAARYLATLDDAAFGAASEVTPKFVSPSDPAAQTGLFCLRRQLSRRCEVRGDCGRRGHARRSPSGGRRREDDDWPHRRALRPEAADTAYGSAATLNW